MCLYTASDLISRSVRQILTTQSNSGGLQHIDLPAGRSSTGVGAEVNCCESCFWNSRRLYLTGDGSRAVRGHMLNCHKAQQHIGRIRTYGLQNMLGNGSLRLIWCVRKKKAQKFAEDRHFCKLCTLDD